jgi:hypothetical protein
MAPSAAVIGLTQQNIFGPPAMIQAIENSIAMNADLAGPGRTRKSPSIPFNESAAACGPLLLTKGNPSAVLLAVVLVGVNAVQRETVPIGQAHILIKLNEGTPARIVCDSSTAVILIRFKTGVVASSNHAPPDAMDAGAALTVGCIHGTG